MDGIGIYARRLSTRIDGGPVEMAKRAAGNGVRAVAIMGAWQEPSGSRIVTTAPNTGRADAYIEQLRSHGIECWLWGYPWGGAHTDFVRAMEGCAQPELLTGWMLDPELGLKWGIKHAPKSIDIVDTMRQGEAIAGTASGTQAQRRAQARSLMDASIGACSARGRIPKRRLSITSYGRARFHPNFPWTEFAAPHDVEVTGSPQLYTATPAEVDAGIAEWRAHGYTRIEPSVGTFGARSGAKLHEHLSTFVDGVERVDGFWFWSWQQTDSQEWRVIARWASWFERGVVAASTVPLAC